MSEMTGAGDQQSLSTTFNDAAAKNTETGEIGPSVAEANGDQQSAAPAFNAAAGADRAGSPASADNTGAGGDDKGSGDKGGAGAGTPPQIGLDHPDWLRNEKADQAEQAENDRQEEKDKKHEEVEEAKKAETETQNIKAKDSSAGTTNTQRKKHDFTP